MFRNYCGNSACIRATSGRVRKFDANTVAIAKAEGADIMLWSIDSMDWSKRASIENMKTLISGQKLRAFPVPRYA